jgi:hypothetical protein
MHVYTLNLGMTIHDIFFGLLKKYHINFLLIIIVMI